MTHFDGQEPSGFTESSFIGMNPPKPEVIITNSTTNNTNNTNNTEIESSDDS